MYHEVSYTVVLGIFPNSRFMSATLYDSHVTTSPGNYLYDYQFPPLFSDMVNPFTPWTPYQPNQMYGFTVSFGGAMGAVAPGCGTTSTFGQTVFNASQIHPGYTWNGAVYPPPPPPFPAHQTGANSGGIIMLRDYFDYGFQNGKTLPPAPTVFVVQLSNGCPLTAEQATTSDNPTGKPIVSVTEKVSSTQPG